MYKSIDMIKTGIRLKRMINEAGYNVRYIQSYLHLSCPQSIYRWFKGKTLPSVEHLSALSDLLHVSMNELLVLQEKPAIDRYDVNRDGSRQRRLLAYATLFRKAS